MKYHVTGSCFLPGVHPDNQRIDRTVEAASAEAAVEQTFKGAYHGAIWVQADKYKPGQFTAMYAGRACGSAKAVEVVS